MGRFETGISDFVHFPITLDITFPIDRKGNPIIACEYCQLFTGRRCTVTEEVIYGAEKYVGFHCPLKQTKEDPN